MEAHDKVPVTRAVWSAVDAAANPASTLILLAVLVRALSASNYGILIIALAASGLSMAINPALAATTTKFVSELREERNRDGRKIAEVITVSLLIVGLIDLVLLIVTAIFRERIASWVFGITHASDLGWVLWLAVLAVGIQQVDTVIAAAIRGMERFRLQAQIEVISRASLTGLVAVVAWYSNSLEKILVAQSAVYMASTVFRAVALRRLLPDRRLFALSTRTDSRAVFTYGGWMWLAALAGVAYTSADRLFIGRSIGPAAAGRFNIYVQITQMIHFIPASLFAFSLPIFSRLAAQGEARTGAMALVYKSYMHAICLTAFGIAAALLLSWSFLMKVFAGPEFAGAEFLAPGLLAVNFTLLACNVIPYYLLLALGYAKEVAMITVISMLIGLVMMAVLIPRFGLEGAAVSRLAYGIGTMMLLYKARRLMVRA